MTSIPIGLVGVGKIARDQHLPALAESPDFQVAAVATHHGAPDGLRAFTSIEAMLEAVPEIEAVTLCTPPIGRFAAARHAILNGKHVMLEKPPGATVAEVEALIAMAREAGVTLFATWHSREAAAVETARAWLADRTVTGGRIVWKEDVRRWHPGQEWIFEAGGLGVFDPAINALSIITRILPQALVLEDGELEFPSNRQAPIRARLSLRTGQAAIVAELDFLQTGPQTWDIELETDGGRLLLSDGGGTMTIDDEPASTPITRLLDGEYPNLYARFARLIRSGDSDVDLAPFRLTADAFMLGRRKDVEAFEF